MKKYIILLIAVLYMSGWVCLSAADAAVPRGKSAAAGLLPDELKSMKIDDYFVETNAVPAGSIQSVSGHLVVVHKDTNRAYFAAEGDAIYQQDVFYTLKDSRCRVKFSTEDIVTMGENSKIVADEIVDDQAAQKKSSVISMIRGKAMFYVVRLFKHKSVSASVRTPTAVMGVRGTKFGVDVRKVGEKVADLSDDSFIYLAQNESGNTETVVYGFEGEVEVTSSGDGSTNTVGAGETLVVDNLGAGDVGQTDPNAANQFIQDTEGGAGTGGTAGTDTGSGDGGLTGDTTDNTSDSEGYGSTLTGTANDQITGPVNRMGYFSAMLTAYNIEGGYYNNGVFVSSSLQDLNGADNRADSLDYGKTMYVDGLTGSAGKLTSVDYYPSSGITGTYPISRTEISHNAYMEWGYWTQTIAMTDDYGYDNWINTRGYYIAGDNTSNTDMATLQSSEAWWKFSGGAEGTYWTSDGGANMTTGSFDAKVQFSSGSIQEFNMAVTGGGHNVNVTGASGYFEGTSHFTLSGGGEGGGTAYIDSPANSGYFNASGSFYGAGAQAIGGVWGVEAYDYSTYQNKYGAGVFHGEKKEVTDPPVTDPPVGRVIAGVN